MRKILSGIVGLIIGLAMAVGSLAKSGEAQRSGTVPDLDAGSMAFTALFVFGGLYYLVAGLRERAQARKTEAP